MSQSPIEIKTPHTLWIQEAEALFKIAYPVGDFPGKLKESEHPVFELDEPSSGAFPEVIFRGYPYQLAQVHVHRSQEHVIDHKENEALEIHFVHIPKGSSLRGTPGRPVPDPKVVLGILFKPQREPETSRKLHFLRAENIPGAINPSSFFPSNPKAKSDWYHYEGSLTGSPYTENVSWFLLKEHGSVTDEEFQQIRAAEHSARGLQPLDRRLIVRSFEK